MHWLEGLPVVTGEHHRGLLRRAYRHAGYHSEDKSTKTAAVLSDHEVFSVGHNHVPAGVVINSYEDEKHKTVHAEDHAIINAASYRLPGSTMHMPWFPCDPCAQLLVGNNIGTLVSHKQHILRTPERWRESLKQAYRTLRGSVEMKVYDGRIGGVTGFMDQQRWNP